jgi:hypothetical protein
MMPDDIRSVLEIHELLPLGKRFNCRKARKKDGTLAHANPAAPEVFMDAQKRPVYSLDQKVVAKK